MHLWGVILILTRQLVIALTLIQLSCSKEDDENKEAGQEENKPLGTVPNYKAEDLERHSGKALPSEFLGTPVENAKEKGKYWEEQDLIEPQGNLSLWIPPHTKEVKGIFFPQGMTVKPNDSLLFHSKEVLAARQMASLWDFALLTGVVWTQENRSSKEKQKEQFLTALDWFATETNHPEIKEVPFVIEGFSRFSGLCHSIAHRIPQKVISCSIVAMGFSPKTAVEENKSIPTLAIPGQRDDGEKKVTSVQSSREKGYLSSYAMNWKVGHACKKCRTLSWAFHDHNVRAQLKGSEVNRISENDGWLASPNWNTISPFKDYTEDKLKAAWFPTQQSAIVWRAFVLQEPSASISKPWQSHHWKKDFAQAPSNITEEDEVELQGSTSLEAEGFAFYDQNLKKYESVIAEKKKGGKTITAKVTLPAGLHTFFIGDKDGNPKSHPIGIVVVGK